MEQTEFIKTILDILSSISDISTNTTKEYIGLHKGNIMFGKIVGQKVLLLNHVYKFTEVENTLITKLLKPELERETADLDIFLRQSTKAWWLACGGCCAPGILVHPCARREVHFILTFLLHFVILHFKFRYKVFSIRIPF